MLTVLEGGVMPLLFLGKTIDKKKNSKFLFVFSREGERVPRLDTGETKTYVKNARL
jgi:hypothetical protein